MSISSGEIGVVGFSCDPLLSKMSGELDTATRRLPEGEPLRVAFPMARPDAPSISYAHQALDYGSRPNVVPEVWVPTPDGFEMVTDPAEFRERVRGGLWVPEDDDATVKLVTQLGQRKDLHGLVPLLPGATRRGETAIREAINVDLDHDSISPFNDRAPTTPVGMLKSAEFVAGKSLAKTTGRIAVIGYGPLVGRPLREQVLPDAGVPDSRVDVFKDRDDIKGVVEQLNAGDGTHKWIFSAVPVPKMIKQIPRGARLIDVGYGVSQEDGRPYGNADPELLGRSAQTRSLAVRLGLRSIVTSFRRGSGPITIAEVFARSAEYQKIARMSGSLGLSTELLDSLR